MNKEEAMKNHKVRYYNKDYQAQYRNETTNSVWKLTEQEKIALGIIKKPKPLGNMIHIVVPEHYGAQGMMWASRFIPESQLQYYQDNYPNLQVIERRDLCRT